MVRLLVALAVTAAWAANPVCAQSNAPARGGESQLPAIIQDYREGLAGIRAANPNVHLSLGRDSSIADERILFVEYPAPTTDPAGRDVQCVAIKRNWTDGRAISFQIKPDHVMRLSLSFMDRNRVAYTAWIDLQAAIWQSIRIPFDTMRPNPFFQPPGATPGAPIDVSDVKQISFAPQDKTPGRLAIGSFVVSR